MLLIPCYEPIWLKENTDDEDFDDELEIMVQSTLSNIPIKAMDWRKIQQATKDDPILQGLKSMIINGWPDHVQSSIRSATLLASQR